MVIERNLGIFFVFDTSANPARFVTTVNITSAVQADAAQFGPDGYLYIVKLGGTVERYITQGATGLRHLDTWASYGGYLGFDDGTEIIWSSYNNRVPEKI